MSPVVGIPVILAPSPAKLVAVAIPVISTPAGLEATLVEFVILSLRTELSIPVNLDPSP